jgi:hypothetical protein
MDKSEALFLADELEAPLGTVIGAELYRRAAKELRRLHAELERCKQVCAATAEGWRVERDALLEALRWIDRRCPEPNWADVEPHRIHFEMAHDAGACARAAIASVEETK